MKKQAFLVSVLSAAILVAIVIGISVYSYMPYKSSSDVAVINEHHSLPDHDTLLFDYLENRISGKASYSYSAGDRFDGVQRALYDGLNKLICKVASGQLASTGKRRRRKHHSQNSWTQRE